MIFIDTGAFLARYIERDQHHDAAIDHWRMLQNDRRHCFTSNFVLDETITLLARRTTTNLLRSALGICMNPVHC